MKTKKVKGNGKVNKGAPSGFVISLIFHAAAFFIAGLFVVFTVVNRPEPEFVPPPPVERPKMKLKKPKVKVKKSSQPKPSSRIVAKVKTREMPEIQLPDLMGTGEGLLGGTGLGGEFMDLPEIGEMSLFGGETTSGMDLQVSFYNFRRFRNGTPNPNMAHAYYFKEIADFVDGGWNISKIAKYYRSPRKLYASCVAIPIVTSMVGPAAFGEELTDGFCWAAHYHGKIVHPEGITFRFWGASDDVLNVALDGETVLAANFPWTGVDAYTIGANWNDRAPGSRGVTTDDGAFRCGNTQLVGGGWITLEPGEVRTFDAICGEGPGGEFFAMLMIEVQGERSSYEKNDRGNPMFPLFATEPLTWEMEDAILMNMYEGEAQVTNINVYFNDLASSKPATDEG